LNENTNEAPNDPQKDEECEAIIKMNEYYQILRVSKDSTDVEIKSSYKKLALKFHPDKNQSKLASEAFKKVFIINRIGILRSPMHSLH